VHRRVITLVVSGQIPWPLFVMTWWTWWVGDTLGVLIATPLVLSWLADPAPSGAGRRLSVTLPLVGTLALGFVFSSVCARPEWERLRLLFEWQAESLAHTHSGMPRRLCGCAPDLESFYANAPAVSRQAFHAFVQALLCAAIRACRRCP